VSGNWDEGARTPLDQLDADTIFGTLIAHDVAFVVIGGLAVSAHGYPRGTKHVDLVPSPERANLRRLHAALSELGSEPLEVGDFRADELPMSFAPDALDEGGNWALRTAAGRVDVLQWIPGIDEGYDRLRSNALDVEVPGVGRVLFAGYDDLVAMKRAAGRPQDAADLHELEQVRGS
jgi:hypothetical protein